MKQIIEITVSPTGHIPLPGRLWRYQGKRWPGQRHTTAVDGQLHVARDVRAPFPDPL